MQNIPHLFQGLRGIRHMMKNTDHRSRIEQAIDERQAINIGRNINIFFRPAKSLPGLLQLGVRIIQQDDPLKAGVTRCVPARAGTELATMTQTIKRGQSFTFVVDPGPARNAGCDTTQLQITIDHITP